MAGYNSKVWMLLQSSVSHALVATTTGKTERSILSSRGALGRSLVPAAGPEETTRAPGRLLRRGAQCGPRRGSAEQLSLSDGGRGTETSLLLDC
ncbi:unnamed protein product [Arctogadus glacialis]